MSDQMRDCVTTFVSVGNSPMPIPRPLPRRLLGVWAHPDDECYLSAGLMARVVAAGGSVRLLCATRGERGTSDMGLFGSEEFGRQREVELRESLAVLGVSDVRFLGLSDGECDQADPVRTVQTVAAEVADFQPDTVVTFGPDGITGHSDHLAVSRWATAATPAIGDAELLYAAMAHDHIDRHREMHDRLGLFADFPDGRPRCISYRTVAMQCSLDHAELIRKRRALSCHGSQTAGLAGLMGEDTYFSWWRDETFRRPTPSERADALVTVRSPYPAPVLVGASA